MENLTLNFNSGVDVYDLKGSETNRFLNKREGTMLDTNFIIDRNSEPIPIDKVLNLLFIIKKKSSIIIILSQGFLPLYRPSPSQ